MLLSRSLMSSTLNRRSTLADPSTRPSRRKEPTPLEYRTTSVRGRAACPPASSPRGSSAATAKLTPPSQATATSNRIIHFIVGLLVTGGCGPRPAWRTDRQGNRPLQCPPPRRSGPAAGGHRRGNPPTPGMAQDADAP